jgi:hypothetical protein
LEYRNYCWLFVSILGCVYIENAEFKNYENIRIIHIVWFYQIV